MQIHITKNVEETMELAKKIAENISKKTKGITIFCLHGEMAAGKTHFSKGFAKGLGIIEDITSPTFSIHNIYEYEFGTLHHFDFYRIDKEQAMDLDLDEYFYEDKTIHLIEWSENIENLIPKNVIHVYIKKLSASEREVIVDENNEYIWNEARSY